MVLVWPLWVPSSLYLALKDPALREKSIEALNKEKKALSSTILTLMSPEDADWDIAIKKAVSGRYLDYQTKRNS